MNELQQCIDMALISPDCSQKSLEVLLVQSLTCRSAVPGERVPSEALCAAFAVRPRSVVDAAQTVARVRVTGPRGYAGVSIPAAVTGKADAVGVVVAITTLLTVGTLVPRPALDTERLAVGV